MVADLQSQGEARATDVICLTTAIHAAGRQRHRFEHGWRGDQDEYEVVEPPADIETGGTTRERASSYAFSERP